METKKYSDYCSIEEIKPTDKQIKNKNYDKDLEEISIESILKNNNNNCDDKLNHDYIFTSLYHSNNNNNNSFFDLENFSNEKKEDIKKELGENTCYSLSNLVEDKVDQKNRNQLLYAFEKFKDFFVSNISRHLKYFTLTKNISEDVYYASIPFMQDNIYHHVAGHFDDQDLGLLKNLYQQNRRNFFSLACIASKDFCNQNDVKIRDFHTNILFSLRGNHNNPDYYCSKFDCIDYSEKMAWFYVLIKFTKEY